MEININIDESRFKDVLENELEAFSKEELHAIIRDCLIKCMSNPEILNSLFLVKRRGYSCGEYYEAGEILKNAAKSLDLSPLFEDFKEKAILYLKEHHNNIIQKLFLDVFLHGLKHDIVYGPNFMDMLREEILQRIKS